MRNTLLVLLPLPLLAACETIPDASAGTCDATRVQNFVGALGTADLGTALLKRSGARTLRWLAPSTMATMDYRQDRLNVRVDGRNFVTGVDCG
jgi:hypothetical protein